MKDQGTKKREKFNGEQNKRENLKKKIYMGER